MADRGNDTESGLAVTAGDPNLKLRLKGAQKDVPASIPKLKFNLPPLTWVGKDLARWVLLIMAGSIVVLMSYLFYMEGKIGRDVGGAYNWALDASKAGLEFKELDRLETTTADLRMARKSADWQMSEASLRSAQGVLRTTARLPSVSDAQRDQLRRCIPLPTDSGRNEALNQCVEILERIDREAWGALATATNTGVAGEFATKLHEQRQNLHQFWIQAAQLILLNLLLPLLTALFGYIFGRQHGDWSETKQAE
jgi:hypothetical protein